MVRMTTLTVLLVDDEWAMLGVSVGEVVGWLMCQLKLTLQNVLKNL
jgi:hypothetical protein